jgi:hypothetical protein
VVGESGPDFGGEGAGNVEAEVAGEVTGVDAGDRF